MRKGLINCQKIEMNLLKLYIGIIINNHQLQNDINPILPH